MRLHRFYINPEAQELEHTFWLKDKNIRHQWQKVFRYKIGAEVVLFDGAHEKQYQIVAIAEDAVKLELITERTAEGSLKGGKKMLFFSLLKRDNSELIIQKGTELGITHFVPLVTARTIVKEFDDERMSKIAIEAAEQCGRVDIPIILEVCDLTSALQRHTQGIKLYYAEKIGEQPINRSQIVKTQGAGVCIGPEGGWTEDELRVLTETAEPVTLSIFTLRAETAAIVAASFLAERELL